MAIQLKLTGCCGMLEIDGLSTVDTAELGMKGLCTTLEANPHNYMPQGAANPQGLAGARFGLLIFSGVVARVQTDHYSGRRDDYGAAFNDYILEKRLGPVVAGPAATNPRTNNTVRAWTWAPDKAALNGWWIANRPPAPPTPENIPIDLTQFDLRQFTHDNFTGYWTVADNRNQRILQFSLANERVHIHHMVGGVLAVSHQNMTPAQLGFIRGLDQQRQYRDAAAAGQGQYIIYPWNGQLGNAAGNWVGAAQGGAYGNGGNAAQGQNVQDMQQGNAHNGAGPEGPQPPVQPTR